jgi:hypothetical protein
MASAPVGMSSVARLRASARVWTVSVHLCVAIPERSSHEVTQRQNEQGDDNEAEIVDHDSDEDRQNERTCQ